MGGLPARTGKGARGMETGVFRGASRSEGALVKGSADLGVQPGQVLTCYVGK